MAADTVLLLVAVGPPTMAVRSSVEVEVEVEEVAVAFCGREVLVTSAIPGELFGIPTIEVTRSLGTEGIEIEDVCAFA